MEYLQAFVLGIVQGITEFLPISSTAHLLVFTKIMGWQELGAKDYVDAIQLGSVFAVVIYFWTDINTLVNGALKAVQAKDWQQEEWKIVKGIAIGSIPALAVGYLTKGKIPEAMVVIAIASIVMAILLGVAEQIGKRQRNFDQLEVQDGILVGIGQMLALVPGVSRSGATLTAALFLGLNRETAARFSFLLGIPTLTIATIYQSIKVIQHIAPGLLIVGIVSTFIFSYLAIFGLMRFLRTQSTWVFVGYRLFFGASILLAVATGKLQG